MSVGRSVVDLLDLLALPDALRSVDAHHPFKGLLMESQTNGHADGRHSDGERPKGSA